MLPEGAAGSHPTTAVLTQLVPATGGPDSQLCSRNVPGLAGETSAGNILMRSGFHASRKPSTVNQRGVRPPPTTPRPEPVPGGPAV